jgi:hypothetical protein
VKTPGAALVRAAAADRDITVQGVDMDSGVGNTGNTAGTGRMTPPLRDAATHEISHGHMEPGRTRARKLRASG